MRLTVGPRLAIGLRESMTTPLGDRVVSWTSGIDELGSRSD